MAANKGGRKERVRDAGKQEAGLSNGEGGEERQRITSWRTGLETDSAGGLRQHEDGGRLGGKTPTLCLPRWWWGGKG